MRQFKRYHLTVHTIEEILEQKPCTGKILKLVPLNKWGNRGLCFFYGMRITTPNPLFVRLSSRRSLRGILCHPVIRINKNEILYD